MTDTDTLVAPSLMFMADASLSVDSAFTTEFAAGKSGGQDLMIKDVPLFRSGTFSDSMGEVHTYEKFHIDGFVNNFNHLKSNKIFEDVPARKGHRQGGLFAASDPIDGVVGYVESIRSEKRKAPHDGNEYEYLIGDVRIISEEAKQNVQSGLWRQRSAEIGTFKGNDGAEYSPAFLGFAFVDIGAIQGLNFSQENTSVLFMEDTMNAGVVTPPVPGAKPPFMFTCGPNQVLEPEKVQAYIKTVEANFASAQAQISTKDAEIASLKEYKDTIEKSARTDFVNGLVESNKLLVTQKDDTLKLVADFSNEQFDSWKTIMGSVPANPLLGQHGNQESRETQNEGNSDYSQVDNDKAVLKDLLRMGKGEEVLKGTKAYQRLLAADANFSLASI